jgi:lipoprotein signal peptidase
MVWLDLWSKKWAFSSLPAHGARTWIPGLIEFRRSLNDGAVFGSFTGYVGLFVTASVLALIFVFYLFARSDRRQWLLHVCLALVLAGALGNLYDRAFVIADVVEVQHRGEELSIIGKIVSNPDDPEVQIGQWPDGDNVRGPYLRDEVKVRTQGVVRDFIKFTPHFPQSVPKLGGMEMWPWVFNVADASLVVGVIVLLLTSVFERRPSEEEM